MVQKVLKRRDGDRRAAIFAVLITLMVMFAVFITTSAEETCAATYNPVPVVDGDTRWVNVEKIGETDGCEITEFNYVPNESPQDILIPAEINGMQVKRIAEGAFAGKGLRYVKFADGSVLESIGDRAFKGNSIEQIDSNGSASTAILPVTVTSIGEECFHGNQIKVVDLKDLAGLKVMTNNSFAENGAKISTLKLPKNLEEMGEYVFNNSINNRGVGTIKVPSTVNKVTLNSFAGFHTHLDLTDFEPEALYGYPWAGSSTAKWKDTNGKDASYDTPFLFDKEQQLIYGVKDDIADKSYPGWNHTSTSGKIVVPAMIDNVKVRKVACGTFCTTAVANRDLIKEVEFENGLEITEIPSYFFMRLYYLTKVEGVPSTVTTIKNRAFNQCTNNSTIENIVFPGVTKVENTAFYFCFGVKSLTFQSDAMQGIGTDAYRGTQKLTKIYYNNMTKGSVTNPASGNTFAEVHWADGAITPGQYALIPDDDNEWYVDVEKKRIMGYIGSKSEITVPATVTVNGKTAPMVYVGDGITNMLNFNDNITGFDKVTIGTGIKQITAHAFETGQIGELDLGADKEGCVLERIDLNAFSGSRCGNVKLPKTLKHIGTMAFNNCRMDGVLTLPGNLTFVGGNSFSGNNFSKVDVDMYLNSPADPGAYDSDRKLYKKAPPDVWQNQPWGAKTAASQVYYKDEPQVIPKHEVKNNIADNMVIVSYKGFTNGAFTIVKEITAEAGIPELTDVAYPTQNGLKNPAVADMEIASKTAGGVRGGNGKYTVDMTFGSQSGSSGVDDKTTAYEITINNFKQLTYDANGKGKDVEGSAPEAEDVYVAGYSPALADADSMSITGYTFGGWNEREDGKGETHQPGQEHKTYAMPNQNATLFAVWNANDNAVTFDANGSDEAPAYFDGDTQITSKELTGKTDQTLSSIDGYSMPARTGYVFMGWSLAPEADTSDIEAVPATTDNKVTVYAVWEAGDGQSVEFNFNEGKYGDDVERTLTGTTEQPLTEMENYVEPEREGYEFLGWAKEKGAKTPDIDKVPAGGGVVFAVWKANKCKVTFNFNGGNFEGETTREVTDDYDKEFVDMDGYKEPERAGHNFKGWADKAEGGVPKTTVKGEETVYAVWEKKIITVTFNANGGIIDKSTHKDVSAPYGTELDKPFDYEEPEREDYDFVGWSIEHTAEEPDIYRFPDSNRTVYAVWKATKATDGDVEAALSRIAEIQADVDGKEVSTDGSDIWAKDDWVTQEIKETMQQAIDTATRAVGEDEVTLIKLKEAMATLEEAKTVFDGEKQKGSKDAKADIAAAEAAVKAANDANTETDKAISTAEGTKSVEDADKAVAAAKAALASAEEAVAKAETAVVNAGKAGIEADSEKASKVKEDALLAKAKADENLVRALDVKKATEKKEEEEPKNIPQEVTPDDPAPIAAVDKLITTGNSDKDMKGSTYAPLKMNSKSQTKKSIKLKWSKVKGAKQYVVYGNQCGTKNKMKKLATVNGSSYNVKKILNKKLKKGTYYKFTVVAVNGNKALAISKTMHISTKGKKKAANHTKVTVTKKVVKKAKALKKGKTLKLKAKAVTKKGMKVKKHVKVRYESSNKKIATVSTAGKVKGVNKGKCVVYAYAQNGIAKKINIVVK